MLTVAQEHPADFDEVPADEFLGDGETPWNISRSHGNDRSFNPQSRPTAAVARERPGAASTASVIGGVLSSDPAASARPTA